MVTTLDVRHDDQRLPGKFPETTPEAHFRRQEPHLRKLTWVHKTRPSGSNFLMTIGSGKSSTCAEGWTFRGMDMSAQLEWPVQTKRKYLKRWSRQEHENGNVLDK